MNKTTWTLTLGLSLVLATAMAGCARQQAAPQTGAPQVSASRSLVSRTAPAHCPQSSVPGFSCTDPRVSVTPSRSLRNGQRITVQVSGFAEGGKVFLSECATSAAANPGGCGPQLAAQPFFLTGNNRAGSATFTVSDRASAKAYSVAHTLECADRCVIVATLGLGLTHDFAYASVTFKG